MKRVSTISICVVAVLLTPGCKKTERPAEAEIGVLKPPDELQVQWDKIHAIVAKHPDLQKEVERLLGKYTKEGVGTGDERDLPPIYNMIRDPNAELSAARQALQVFLKLNTKEVIREALLHESPGVVIIASNGLAAEARKGNPDKQAVPYLVHVLAKNNYPKEGSEDATVHGIMKRRLVEAVDETTGLGLAPSKLEVRDSKEVERVLSKARVWAKREGIKLFKE